MKFLLQVCKDHYDSLHAPLWPSDLHLQVTTRRSEAFDGLLSQYEQLGQCLPAVTQVKSLSAESSLQSEIVGVIFRNIFEFHKLALHYFKKAGECLPASRFMAEMLMGSSLATTFLLLMESTQEQVPGIREGRTRP